MRRFPVAALLLVAAGCGSSAGGDYPSLPLARNALPGLQGRECSYAQGGGGTREFVEIARVGTQGQLALWGVGGNAGDTLTLSVRYDDEGRLQWIRALDFRPDQARVPTLVAVLERALRDDFRANWGVRLRIAGDGEVVDVLPSVLCEPKLETYASMPFRPLGTQWEIQDYENARGRWHEVLVSLDELGRAGSVRMARSSMSRIMDEEILALARTAHYSPKLHDGIPVATIFGLKVRAPRRRD